MGKSNRVPSTAEIKAYRKSVLERVDAELAAQVKQCNVCGADFDSDGRAPSIYTQRCPQHAQQWRAENRAANRDRINLKKREAYARKKAADAEIQAMFDALQLYKADNFSFLTESK